jgi:iron complex outermembrane recepter protein
MTIPRLCVTPLLFLVLAVSHASATSVASPVDSDAACSIKSTDPLLSVSITVKDPSAAIVQRAAIDLRCGDTVVNAQTAADGTAALRLHPGTYHLTVLAPGFSDYLQTLTIASPAKTIDVTLAPGSATDVINVTADSGFVPFASNAGSKTGALLIEVPQSISIINTREMEARGVITMNEALRYTPGVQADEYGFEPRFDWLKIRGFSAETFGVFRDGMRFNSLSGKLDPYELESVEVLKGPSSVLYGQVPPGGLINQVTKRPPAERQNEIGVQFGAYDRRQIQGDFGGPIDKQQIWRYRLLGLVRDSGTQVDFTPDNRRLIAPSLTWHPSDRTNITGLADWQHDGTRWSQFLPSQGTLTFNPNGIIPVSTFVGEPDWEKVKRDQASLAYTGDHLFTDGWNFHSNYRYQYINFQGTTVYGNGFDPSIPNNFNLVARTAYALPRWNHINTIDNRALRRFQTSNWEHTVLFGYDYAHVDIKSKQGFVSMPNIDIFHPVYGAPVPALNYYIDQDSLLQQHGLYAQDQIKYKNHLVFTLGGRQDFAINDVKDFLTPSASSSQTDNRFTGRAGVTYLTDMGIAPYFAYSTSFLPNPATPIYNGPNQPYTQAKPSDGRQFEGGVKIQPRTWNSFITASLFDLTETNVIVTDAAFNSLQSGKVRSRGVELEGVAELGHGLNLHAGYSLTATTTLEDATPANIGKWLPQTPRNLTSFLADYTVHDGILSGLGGNFGVRFVGTAAGDSANTIFVPNYTLLDGALRYGWRNTLFSVNATNLTDRRYVATCSGVNYCGYGYARNVIGSAKYRF